MTLNFLSKHIKLFLSVPRDVDTVPRVRGNSIFKKQDNAELFISTTSNKFLLVLSLLIYAFIINPENILLPKANGCQQE